MGVQAKKNPMLPDVQPAALQTRRAGGPSDHGFPEKPTCDKHSESQCFEGQVLPGLCGRERIYKHLPNPPDETKDSSACFPWERHGDETTFQPNEDPAEGKNGSRQYVKVRSLPGGGGHFGVS